jgi:LmbE family N-acetylglucosaminyl deacetylase
LIIPIVHENAWLEATQGLPAFLEGRGPIVLISPHPDDETLGAGGYLAAEAKSGRPVTVIAVTNGEHAYPDCPGLGEVRIQEQEEALRVLCDGRAELVRLGLTDSAVSTTEDRLTELLSPFISEHAHVLAPWEGDFHPDHEACGRAAAALARSVGARLTWYFFWTWHRGTPATMQALHLSAFPLTAELQEIKSRALLCHASQLNHVSGEPILPDYLLAPARRDFEVFAEA